MSQGRQRFPDKRFFFSCSLSTSLTNGFKEFDLCISDSTFCLLLYPIRQAHNTKLHFAPSSLFKDHYHIYVLYILLSFSFLAPTSTSTLTFFHTYVHYAFCPFFGVCICSWLSLCDTEYLCIRSLTYFLTFFFHLDK